MTDIFILYGVFERLSFLVSRRGAFKKRVGGEGGFYQKAIEK
jgi:hypothetical protein